MQRIKLTLPTRAKILASMRARIHKPTKAHKNPRAYTRKDKSWQTA